jgi:hypothetical protein
MLFPWEKVRRKLGLLQYSFKTQPIVRKSPTGENSPNPVTFVNEETDYANGVSFPLQEQKTRVRRPPGYMSGF